MLGEAVVEAAYAAGHEVIASDEDIIGIEPKRLVGEAVINCAGIVPQNENASELEMVRVNAYGPHYLAALARRLHFRLLHISTDCVFSLPGPHAEEDTPSPFDLYGASKLAGEIIEGNVLTLRTSFVGFGKRGLFHDLQTKPTLEASDRLFWSGHTLQTIAEVLVDLAGRENVRGLLHVPGEFTTRLVLCRKLVQFFHLPTQITENFFTRDRRLISRRWEQFGLSPLPTFEEQLMRLKESVAL